MGIHNKREYTKEEEERRAQAQARYIEENGQAAWDALTSSEKHRHKNKGLPRIQAIRNEQYRRSKSKTKAKMSTAANGKKSIKSLSHYCDLMAAGTQAEPVQIQKSPTKKRQVIELESSKAKKVQQSMSNKNDDDDEVELVEQKASSKPSDDDDEVEVIGVFSSEQSNTKMVKSSVKTDAPEPVQSDNLTVGSTKSKTPPSVEKSAVETASPQMPDTLASFSGVSQQSILRKMVDESSSTTTLQSILPEMVDESNSTTTDAPEPVHSGSSPSKSEQQQLVVKESNVSNTQKRRHDNTSTTPKALKKRRISLGKKSPSSSKHVCFADNVRDIQRVSTRKANEPKRSISALQAQVNALKKELASCQLEIRDLKRASSLPHDLLSLQHKFAGASDKEALYYSEIENHWKPIGKDNVRLARENQRWSERHERDQSEIKRLLNEKAALERELLRLIYQNASLAGQQNQGQLQRLWNENASLREARQVDQAKIASSQKKQEDQEDEIAKLKAQRQSDQEEISDLRMTIVIAEEAELRAETRANALSFRNEERQQDYEKKKDSLEAEAAHMNDLVTSLQTENGALKDEVARLNELLTSVMAENGALREENNKFREPIRDLENGNRGTVQHSQQYNGRSGGGRGHRHHGGHHHGRRHRR